MNRVLIIYTGGTIGMTRTDDGYAPRSGYFRAALDNISDLHAPEMPAWDFMEMSPLLDSSNMTVHEWNRIAAIVAQRYDAYDGFVVLHGTDTMAYTAAILDRMMDCCPIPVIITGSQRPFFADDSDGKANLLNALNAACESFGGVHILFGDKLIRGGRAYKAYTRSDNAFISPSGKYSGTISGGKLICSEKKPDGKYIFRSDFSHKAGLIKITPMTRPEEIESAAKLYDGIVIEGYGIGDIPTRLLPAIKKAISGGVKCVLISQCLFEGVSMGVYEVGTQAKDIGVISGGDLTAEGALARLIFGEI